MTRPDNAGPATPATVTAPDGVIVRSAPSRNAAKMTSFLTESRVNLYSATALHTDGLTWMYVELASWPARAGYAAQASDVDGVWITPDAPEPVTPTPITPGLYSDALTADEVQNLVDLFGRAAEQTIALGTVYAAIADVYKTAHDRLANG